MPHLGFPSQYATVHGVAKSLTRLSDFIFLSFFLHCLRAAITNYHKLSDFDGGLVTKSCPTLATSRTVAHQVPLSMGFSRQEYWSGLPFPLSGDLTNRGIEPGSPALQADSLLREPPRKPPSD